MRFDDPALFGPKPSAMSRADRIELLDRIAADLLAGRMPDRAAALFVGGAISSWLQQGGRLERDFLKVTPRRGSRATPAALWRARHRDVDGAAGDGVK